MNCVYVVVTGISGSWLENSVPVTQAHIICLKVPETKFTVRTKLLYSIHKISKNIFRLILTL